MSNYKKIRKPVFIPGDVAINNLAEIAIIKISKFDKLNNRWSYMINVEGGLQEQWFTDDHIYDEGWDKYDPNKPITIKVSDYE